MGTDDIWAVLAWLYACAMWRPRWQNVAWTAVVLWTAVAFYKTGRGARHDASQELLVARNALRVRFEVDSIALARTIREDDEVMMALDDSLQHERQMGQPRCAVWRSR